MRCLKIPSKFVKSLTFGASISWDLSHHQKETNTYLWLSITYRNGLKQRRYNNDATSLQRSCLNMESLIVSPPRITLRQVGRLSWYRIVVLKNSDKDSGPGTKIVLLVGQILAMTLIGPAYSITQNYPSGALVQACIWKRPMSSADFELEHKSLLGHLSMQTSDLKTAGDNAKFNFNDLCGMRDQPMENYLILHEEGGKLKES
ncbi:hypothetical protein Tco_0786228 [Tanacetum coccineum]